MTTEPNDTSESIFEIDLRWSGNEKVPAFHEVTTLGYPANALIGYTELGRACVEQLEVVCQREVAANRKRELEAIQRKELSATTGLDLEQMLAFYGVEDLAGLLKEMDGHIKQLIPQAVASKPTGPHSIKPPRAG